MGKNIWLLAACFLVKVSSYLQRGAFIIFRINTPLLGIKMTVLSLSAPPWC